MPESAVTGAAAMPLLGGCHCGDVRYEISAPPLEAGYCHCSICRRTTGAPVLAWAVVPIAGFRYLGAAPRVYRSSPWGERRVCPNCGAQLEYRRAENPATVELNIGTLDDPDVIRPGSHVWTVDALSWLHIEDDLPRYREGGPD